MTVLITPQSQPFFTYPNGAIALQAKDFLGTGRSTLSTVADPSSIVGTIVRDEQIVPWNSSLGTMLNAALPTLNIIAGDIGIVPNMSAYDVYVWVSTVGITDATHIAADMVNNLNGENFRRRATNAWGIGLRDHTTNYFIDPLPTERIGWSGEIIINLSWFPTLLTSNLIIKAFRSGSIGVGAYINIDQVILIPSNFPTGPNSFHMNFMINGTGSGDVGRPTGDVTPDVRSESTALLGPNSRSVWQYIGAFTSLTEIQTGRTPEGMEYTIRNGRRQTFLGTDAWQSSTANQQFDLLTLVKPVFINSTTLINDSLARSQSPGNQWSPTPEGYLYAGLYTERKTASPTKFDLARVEPALNGSVKQFDMTGSKARMILDVPGFDDFPTPVHNLARASIWVGVSRQQIVTTNNFGNASVTQNGSIVCGDANDTNTTVTVDFDWTPITGYDFIKFGLSIPPDIGNDIFGQGSSRVSTILFGPEVVVALSIEGDGSVAARLRAFSGGNQYTPYWPQDSELTIANKVTVESSFHQVGYNLRFNKLRNKIQAKVWPVGSSEPSSWLLSGYVPGARANTNAWDAYPYSSDSTVDKVWPEQFDAGKFPFSDLSFIGVYMESQSNPVSTVHTSWSNLVHSYTADSEGEIPTHLRLTGPDGTILTDDYVIPLGTSSFINLGRAIYWPTPGVGFNLTAFMEGDGPLNAPNAQRIQFNDMWLVPVTFTPISNYNLIPLR